MHKTSERVATVQDPGSIPHSIQCICSLNSLSHFWGSLQFPPFAVLLLLSLVYLLSDAQTLPGPGPNNIKTLPGPWPNEIPAVIVQHPEVAPNAEANRKRC